VKECCVHQTHTRTHTQVHRHTQIHRHTDTQTLQRAPCAEPLSEVSAFLVCVLLHTGVVCVCNVCVCVVCVCVVCVLLHTRVVCVCNVCVVCVCVVCVLLHTGGVCVCVCGVCVCGVRFVAQRSAVLMHCTARSV